MACQFIATAKKSLKWYERQEMLESYGWYTH